ncbi:hypothetical protein MGMO_8c00370 [Methyloglobulus morosus KoM1]|uniref:Uncharacterized protein n=1 Tax=Methyloglobulus morosus KoM1 TaxID=1116472 RepID=V5BKP5_9GAMM|nr:hypothetical protein [Methyloglobulus morosus]ESS73900.1 hypothetical protein MGMO_8c00370 [Methyloglobulus morosus KoM1]
MKTAFITSALLFASLFFLVIAEAETSTDEWQNTTISDATIKKIQEAKYEYKKCIGGQMQKTAFLDMDSRKATEEILKLCEPMLGKMRETYLTEKVPAVMADRHLRQVRIQTTRKLLQELIFAQAGRGAVKP